MSTDMEDPNQMDSKACASIIALSHGRRHSLHNMPDLRFDMERTSGFSLGDLLDLYRSDYRPHFDRGYSLSFAICLASYEPRPGQVLEGRETLYAIQASLETMVYDKVAAIKIDRRRQ